MNEYYLHINYDNMLFSLSNKITHFSIFRPNNYLFDLIEKYNISVLDFVKLLASYNNSSKKEYIEKFVILNKHFDLKLEYDKNDIDIFAIKAIPKSIQDEVIWNLQN